LSKLIHSCEFQIQQPALAQYWIGRVAQYSIGADNPVIFDGRNLYDPAQVWALGFEYLVIGR
jgi:hypothetical protein